MKKGSLKENHYYAYTVIKAIFEYYDGKAKTYDADVFMIHLKALRLLNYAGYISQSEYEAYREHMRRASLASDRRATIAE